MCRNIQEPEKTKYETGADGRGKGRKVKKSTETIIVLMLNQEVWRQRRIW